MVLKVGPTAIAVTSFGVFCLDGNEQAPVTGLTVSNLSDLHYCSVLSG